jgi:hypothetical protein
MFYAGHAGSFDVIPRQGAAMVIWGAIAVGIATGFLPRAQVPRACLIPLAGAVLLALITALSLSWTSSDERTFAELARVLHYAGLVVLVLVALDRYTWTAAAGGLLAGAVAVAGLALASRLFPGLVDPSAVGRVFDPSRLEFPLGYWNALGAWCAIAATMALVWSSHAERVLTRVACMAVIPALLATEYMTYSRGGAIGVAVGVVLAIVLARSRWETALHAIIAAAGATIAVLAIRAQPEIAEATGDAGGGTVLAAIIAAGVACGLTAYVTSAVEMKRFRMPSVHARRVVQGLAVILLIATAVVGRPLASEAWERFSDDTEGASGAQTAQRLGSLGSERDEIYESGLHAFSSAPLKGIGAGTFEFWWDRHGSGSTLDDAHSLYVEQLAELGLGGILGTLILLGGVAGLGLVARARADTDRRAGAAAAVLAGFGVYIVLAGIDWYWESTAVTMLALTAAACAMLGLSARGAHRGWPNAGRIVATVVAVFALAIQVPGYLSTLWLRDSQDALEAGEFGRAADLADRAGSFAPWATDPYVQLATIAQQQGRDREAISNVREAIEREPLDWRHRFQLAAIHEARGDGQAALRAAREGKQLSPKTPIVERLLVEMQLRIEGAPPVPPAESSTPESGP